MGQQSKEFAKCIINELELPLSVDEFLYETRKIFNELFLHSKVMPGKLIMNAKCFRDTSFYFDSKITINNHLFILFSFYLFIGVEKLIHHLHKHKIPMGLATSSSKETYDLKAANHQELFKLLPFKTWGSSDPDVKKGKPYPDVFLVAASKFPDKPSPEKVNIWCFLYYPLPTYCKLI